VELAGSEPGKTILAKGEPIVFALTIPRNAPNPKRALELVELILAKDGGLKILEEMGQDTVGPQTYTPGENIPAELQPLMVK